MKRLLIAYDGSECSQAALEELAYAGLPSQLQATVLAVADVWLPSQSAGPAPTFPAALTESIQHARAQAKAELQKAQGMAEAACKQLAASFPGWSLRPLAIADSPAWGIIKTATNDKSDLVVTGSHSHSPLRRFFLGSVAQKVVTEAPCSVHVARPRKHVSHPQLRVLIAMDGSAESLEAVGVVADREWPEHAEFRVITVVDKKMETLVAWPAVLPEEWVQPTDKSGGDWVQRMVGQGEELLKQKKLRTTTDVYDGNPKEVVVREAEAWEADCIFLGAHGLQHGNRQSLGSTATAIATRAHCSVELVRHK